MLAKNDNLHRSNRGQSSGHIFRQRCITSGQSQPTATTSKTSTISPKAIVDCKNRGNIFIKRLLVYRYVSWPLSCGSNPISDKSYRNWGFWIFYWLIWNFACLLSIRVIWMLITSSYFMCIIKRKTQFEVFRYKKISIYF